MLTKTANELIGTRAVVINKLLDTYGQTVTIDQIMLREEGPMGMRVIADGGLPVWIYETDLNYAPDPPRMTNEDLERQRRETVPDGRPVRGFPPLSPAELERIIGEFANWYDTSGLEECDYDRTDGELTWVWAYYENLSQKSAIQREIWRKVFDVVSDMNYDNIRDLVKQLEGARDKDGCGP
jgi:hypothetical protein